MGKWQSFFIALVLSSLVLTACSTASAAKAGTLVTSPPSNSEFREGDPVTITSTSVDPAGIARVEMLVDGKLVHTEQAPVMQQSLIVVQPWTAVLGTHTISVRVVNARGTIDEPAAIVLRVQPAQAQDVVTAMPTESTTANGNCTHNAVLVSDVTLPDGTVLAPGQTVTKIWRVRNTGTCSWGQDDQLIFSRGEPLTPVKAIIVPTTAPGETADLLIPLTAPSTPGKHQGEWRFKSKNGSLYGVPLTVVVNVPGSPSTNCSSGPVIESFTATESTIAVGQSTTLKWGAVTNAERADIDNGIGGIATPGSINIIPRTTTVYTLTARCGPRVTTAQVKVNVR